MSSTTTEDRRGRPVRDLRISVTDRCNMRCRYCMPREVFGPDHAFLPRAELLTFEEIERVTQAAVDVGVEKVRLTGGEPLLRRDLCENDILAQSGDGFPRQNVVVIAAEQTAELFLPRHDQRHDLALFQVDLRVADIAEPLSGGHVDDFFTVHAQNFTAPVDTLERLRRALGINY